MLAILTYFSCISIVAEDMNRDQLIRLIEGARTSVEDVAFEYEGEQRFPRREESESQRLGPEGIATTYSGTYSWRNDGAVRVETYSTDHSAKMSAHSILSTFAGSIESTIQVDGQKNGQVEIKPHDLMWFQQTGYYSRICLRDLLMARVKSEWEFRFDGFTDIDGKACLVINFSSPPIPDLPGLIRSAETFWVDLERGGHVVRHELRWNDDLVSVLQDVRTERFEAESGREVWLPVYGRFETHVAFDMKQKKTYYPKEPVSIETYDMLENTLRLEQGLKDEFFTVKAKPGDLVSDQLKKAKYEFGQYLVRAESERAKPVSDAEIRANLDKMLNDADVMKNELKASSPARSGPDWTTYAPWAVSALALAGLVVLLVRRRAGV